MCSQTLLSQIGSMICLDEFRVITCVASTHNSVFYAVILGHQALSYLDVT